MKLTGWDAVDSALARLATLERRKLRAKGGADKRMAKIKERLKAICKPLDREFKRLREQLERWTFGHADDLQERTRRGAHGAVRLYKTPPAIVSDLSDEELVAVMKAECFGAYIRTVEAPNRALMKDLSDAELETIQCRRESHDEFQWQLAGEEGWR